MCASGNRTQPFLVAMRALHNVVQVDPLPVWSGSCKTTVANLQDAGSVFPCSIYVPTDMTHLVYNIYLWVQTVGRVLQPIKQGN